MNSAKVLKTPFYRTCVAASEFSLATVVMFGCKPFPTDNFKKYKIKHTPRINILIVLKYKTNKTLLKISDIF